jgi:FAD/FMN-containing dehydrogenase
VDRTAATALGELVAELGPAAVLGPGDDVAAFGTPPRGPAGVPAAVLRPASTDDVRTCVRWARRHRVRLLPQGAASGLVGASTPGPEDRDVVVLSTARLVRGLDVHAGDRTAVAPAGLRLSALEAALAPHGLTLPVDLGADPTLGGMVATNTGGSRVLRHGDVRRHVLGVEAVLADEAATVVDDLTVLRKHNPGPRPSALFVGSGGALGVVTRVALDLERRPAHRATALVAPADDRAALDLLVHLETTVGDRLSAYEVCSAEAVAAATSRRGVRQPFPGRPVPLVALVELSGPVSVDDELTAALSGPAAGGPVADAVVVPPGDAWALRHAVTEGLRATGVVVGHDVSVPRHRLPELRSGARAALARAVPRAIVADFGHWGDGGVHCNVVFPPDAPPDGPERARCREVVLGLAVELGGSYSAEHGIGPHNAEWWERCVDPGVRDLLAGVRRLVDPLGILGHPGLPF